MTEHLLPWPTQEPIDVPAVLTSHPCDTQDGRYAACISIDMEAFTCQDKSRILLHSEDGKYWCHKPQP